MKDNIRAMSHNVWNRDYNAPEWEKIGADCSAEVRMKGILRTWRELSPDLIGCQEVSSHIFDLLTADAVDGGMGYAAIPGSYTPIFYKAERFELLESVFFPYPENIEGLEGCFNDVGSKACHIAAFLDKRTDKRVIFANTHLWWKTGDPAKAKMESWYLAGSDEARAYQASLLVDAAGKLCEKHGAPCILLGDLNTGYASKAIETLFSRGFLHAHDIATEYVDETVGYHDCYPWGYDKTYSDAPFETAIDHILVRGLEEGAVKRFERYSPEYYLPISDHSPVFIDFVL